jgi:hypothetical protein
LEDLNELQLSLEKEFEYNWIVTPWSRVFLENLSGFAASQEISRIYGI